jgi:hypothetical protein
MRNSGVVVLNLFDDFILAATLEKSSGFARSKRYGNLAVGGRRYSFFGGGGSAAAIRESLARLLHAAFASCRG